MHRAWQRPAASTPDRSPRQARSRCHLPSAESLRRSSAVWHSSEQRRVRLAARERIRATSMCVRVGRARRRPATREYSIAEGTATHYHGHSNQGSHARWVGGLHHTTPVCISINQSTASVRTTDISKATQPCVCVCVVRTRRRSVPASLEGSSLSSGSSA